MNFIRNKSCFKLIALILGLCFSLFAFHFLAHLDHGADELETCHLCQALTGFFLVVLWAFLFAAISQSGCFYPADAPLFFKRLFTASLRGRAPPRFS